LHASHSTSRSTRVCRCILVAPHAGVDRPCGPSAKWIGPGSYFCLVLLAITGLLFFTV
jgi:hypothetical protein